ncbi:MAG: ribbon-helix-helix domain-containing protein [Terracidiphilus sp.]
MKKLSFALPAQMAATVRRAVEAEEHSSNSEFIRDALRDRTHTRKPRKQRPAGLRKRRQEAVSHDSAGLCAAPVFGRLERKRAGSAWPASQNTLKSQRKSVK